MQFDLVANGAKTFTCSATLTGGGEIKAYSGNVAAAGGQNKESIDSIKINFPFKVENVFDKKL